MTVTVTQDRSEFARNSLRVFFHQGMGRFLLYLSCGLIAFSLLRYGSMLFGFSMPTPYLLVSGIGLLTLLPALIYRKATMVYDANPAINQPMTYTFDEDGIATVGEGIDNKLGWGQLYRVEEIKDAILICYTKDVMNPLPKRCFTDQELERLRELIAAAGY